MPVKLRSQICWHIFVLPGVSRVWDFVFGTVMTNFICRLTLLLVGILRSFLAAPCVISFFSFFTWSPLNLLLFLESSNKHHEKWLVHRQIAGQSTDWVAQKNMKVISENHPISMVNGGYIAGSKATGGCQQLKTNDSWRHPHFFS